MCVFVSAVWSMYTCVYICTSESSWCTQKALGVYSYDLLPHFMMRLRECILRHDWKCVLTIIDCLVHIPRRADWAIFKVVVICCYMFNFTYEHHI